MKLGDIIQFQNAITDSRWDWDEKETIKFAKKNKMPIKFDDIFSGGFCVRSKWKVRKYDLIKEGMVCGVRYIDISGRFEDGYWEFGKRKKVYLVALNMSGFVRVPEEFIITRN